MNRRHPFWVEKQIYPKYIPRSDWSLEWILVVAVVVVAGLALYSGLHGAT